jgi:nitrite reductase/ring-hydroxylating ferredoxin subunit
MYYKLDIKKTDLKEGESKLGKANGKDFSVVLKDGSVNVLDGICTHEGGPLADGYLDKNELICPWHSGAFDIGTGKANENTPWVTDVRHYNIKVDAATGEIEVDL